MEDPKVSSEVRVAERMPDRPAPAPVHGPEKGGDRSLVETDLLVEDVSIDGMCGVY
jgi:mycofactocin precursor